MEHISGMHLPGCGEGGPCEEAMNSVWGTVPFVGWPVSFLGLAYFMGMLAAWISAHGSLPAAFRSLVRLGILASLFFCIIMFVEFLSCPYCIVLHMGNFAFWITMEFSKARTGRAGLTFAIFGIVWAVTSAAAGIWDWQARTAVVEKAEQERSASVQEMVERSHQPPEREEKAVSKTMDGITAEAPLPVYEGAVTTQASQEQVAGPPFTGRYRYGPEEASIRIVMITDYQCRDCRRLEKEAFEVLEGHDSLSLSIKHFPFSPDCNPHVTRNLHPNACWAARAAEAAGILWGDEGFFKMHVWLFERGGVFRTARELEEGIRNIGYDPQGFESVMKRDEVLERIRRDVREAYDLGLHFTPMIFINGVELKGWHTPGALKRTVAELTAQNLPARTAVNDRPPPGLQKYIEDWQDEPVRELPPDTHARILGPREARIQIVLWGDYEEAGTVRADRIIRDFVTGREDANYAFRHFPFNSDCNPHVPDKRHPLACQASRAAEAAGRMAGNDGYWRMHGLLMKKSHAARRQAFEQVLRTAARDMDLDADTLIAGMDRSEVEDAIAEDIAAGKKLPRLRWGASPGLHGIPAIFINGKYVPRWRLQGDAILDHILAAAVTDGDVHL